MEYPIKFEEFGPEFRKEYKVDEKPDQLCTLYHNILSKEECNSILKNHEHKHSNIKDENIYNRSKFSVNDNELSELIWSRIKHLVPEKLDGGKVNGLRTEWRHGRYLKDQYIFPHIDGRKTSNEQQNNKNIGSRFSLTIYLDDEYTGGEFVFVKGVHDDGRYDTIIKTIKPKAGMALLFYQDVSEFSHATLPVKSGVRSIMRSDVLYYFESNEAIMNK